MMTIRLLFCLGLLSSGVAEAQTANGSPTDVAPRGLPGTPRPISRTAPSVGVRGMSPHAKLAPSQMQALPKPTAAERAERRKLDHDLRICIGC